MPNAITNAIEAQERLRMSTVDRSFVLTPTVISSLQIQYIDMPLVLRTFVFSQGFVLDSSVYGVLDTSALDATTESYSLTKVTCPNDIFNWFSTTKEEDLLSHSSTTATVSNTAQTITFTAGQILVLVCYLDTSTIKAGTVILADELLDNIANYTLALSANGGISYTTVNNGTQYTFANADQGTELRLRITAIGTGILSLKKNNGTVFPIQVRYNKT